MNPKLLLKISAVVIFIHAVLHTMGNLNWKVVTGPVYGEVVKQMTGPKFPFMGVPRSMGEFFDGYSYIITVTLTLIASLLWALSDIAEKYPPVGLKLLIPLNVFLVLMVIIELIFFFPFAALFSFVSAMLCTWAIVKLHGRHLDTHATNVK